MKFSTLRDLGTGFLGFLFCLSLSVVLILNFRPLYVYEMKSENLASVSSMTEEEILEEFLRKNRAEVIAVSIFEYDKEEEERKLRKAEFEAGEQSGIQKGIQKGIQEGIQEGKELKTKEIVNSLLQDGMGIEKIAALLKISKEHVLELAGRSKNL